MRALENLRGVLVVAADVLLVLLLATVFVLIASTLAGTNGHPTVLLQLHRIAHFVVGCTFALAALRLGVGGAKWPGFYSRISERLTHTGYVDRLARVLLFAWIALSCLQTIVFVEFSGAVSMDFPIFHSSLRSLVAGEGLRNPIQHIEIYGLEHFADERNEVLPTLAFHQNYILLALAPLYFVPKAYLILQCVPNLVLGGTAWLVFVAARSQSRNAAFPLFMLVCFLAMPVSLSAQQGFFPDVFSILCLGAYFFFERKRLEYPALLAIACLGLIRESYFVISLCIALLALFKRANRSWSWKLLLVAIAQFVIGFIFVKGYIYPGVDDMATFDIFSAFEGDSIPDKAISIISQPILVITMLLREDVLIYALMIVGPFAPLIFRSPHLMASLPLLCLNALSGVDYAIDFRSHHSYPVATILFFGWMNEMSRREKASADNDPRRARPFVFVLLLFSVVSLARLQHSELSFINNARLADGGRETCFDNRVRNRNAVLDLLARVPEGATLSVPLSQYHRFILSNRRVQLFPRGMDSIDHVIRSEAIAARVENDEARPLWREQQTMDRFDRFYFFETDDWSEVVSVDDPGNNQRLILLKRVSR